MALLWSLGAAGQVADRCRDNWRSIPEAEIEQVQQRFERLARWCLKASCCRNDPGPPARSAAPAAARHGRGDLGRAQSADLIARIISALHEAGELALATRVEPSKAEAVIAALAPLPKAALQLVHHLEARYLNGRGVARSRSRPRPHGDPGGRQ